MQKIGKTTNTKSEAQTVIEDIRKKKKEFQLNSAKEMEKKKKCC